jgi:hypothetical protein
MYPHRIRLQGPWQCDAVARSNAGTQPMSFPVMPPGRLRDLGLAGFAGRVQFRRRFGYPGRIDAHERIWLTFQGTTQPFTIALNGQDLSRPEPEDDGFSIHVTELLKARNELVVDLDAPNDETVLGATTMEVRCAAYLRGIRLTLEASDQGNTPALGRLHVRGEVVGQCDEALEVYVVVDRSNVAYGKVTAAESGQPFYLPTNRSTGEWVKVELVRGPTAWYRFDAPFPSSLAAP